MQIIQLCGYKQEQDQNAYIFIKSIYGLLSIPLFVATLIYSL